MGGAILHLVVFDVERSRFLPSVERANTHEFLLIKVCDEEVGTFLKMLQNE